MELQGKGPKEMPRRIPEKDPFFMLFAVGGLGAWDRGYSFLSQHTQKWYLRSLALVGTPTLYTLSTLSLWR